jgi:hypothetical protein
MPVGCIHDHSLFSLLFYSFVFKPGEIVPDKVDLLKRNGLLHFFPRESRKKRRMHSIIPGYSAWNFLSLNIPVIFMYDQQYEQQEQVQALF